MRPLALDNIQQVSVSAVNNVTLDLTNAPDVEAVANVQSSASLTYTNLANSATTLAVISPDAGLDTTFTFANPASVSSVDLIIDELASAGEDAAIVTINGAETVNIETDNLASTFTLNGGATTVNILNNVDGDVDLTLNGATSATLIDATNFTANLTTTLTAAGTLIGGSGNDSLTALNSDGNSISGGNGTDNITAGIGNDTIDGGADDDTISADDGNNSVTGGSGVDSITAGSGNDTIHGNEGDDTINAGNGNNSVSGGTGADSITVGSGNDIVSGNEGNDTISANAGDDSINGGADDDLIQMGGNLTSADTVDGGTGSNTLSSTAANLQTASGSQLTNVSNIQILTATTALSSVLDVNNIDEAINTINLTAGGTGVLQGLNAGATTVNLGDALTGALDLADDSTTTTESVTLVKNYATDEDAFGGVAITATGVETLNLNTGSGVTTTQSTGTVTITGDSTSGNIAVNVTGSNEISLGAVTNTTSTGVFSIDLSGMLAQVSGLTATVAAPALTSGTVSITGSGGNDVLNGDSNSANTIRGGEGVDSIVGGSAADLLHGNEGNDSIWGVGGNDSLYGNSGDDYISVGNTSDTFTAGNVTIDGGEGNDTVNIGNTINVSDSIDGGSSGTQDTLRMSVALIGETTTVSNFEVLQLDAALTQNMALFTTNTGWTQVNATTGNNVINNAGAAVTTAALDDSVGDFTLDRATGVTTGAITVQALQNENTSIANITANEDVTVNFAAGAAASGKTLTVGGLNSVAATAINISGVQNTSVTIGTSGASGGLGTTARTVTIDASSATGTVVYNGTTGASDIAQVITGSSTAASSLTGGAGNDTITLGNAATGNVVDGKNGNNVVTGGTGGDQITTGTGADSINSGTGSDVITAGAGVDLITLGVDATLDRIFQSAESADITNTLSGAISNTSVLVFGSGLDIIDNFNATGAGYDVVAVLKPGTLTSLLSQTSTAITDNKTYFLSGTYNSLTGEFTAADNGAGPDTLIVQVASGTTGATTDINDNITPLLLRGVNSANLSDANFVAQSGLTAAYTGTTYTISGTATASVSMAANGTLTSGGSDAISYYGTFSQANVTAIDASGVTGGFGATINVTGATSAALASVIGTSGSDTFIQASADIGAATSVINGGSGGTDKVTFTTFGTATIYGSVGSGRQYITNIDAIDLTAGATSLTMDSSVSSVIAITNTSSGGTSAAATVNLGATAAHTYSSGSTAIDTVTLGLTGQTATFTDVSTNNVIKGAVVGSAIIMSGAGTNALTLQSAAGNGTLAADTLKANFTGGTGTDTLTLTTGATASGALTTGTLTRIEAIALDAVGASVDITLASGATSVNTVTGTTDTGKDITFRGTLAQLDGLTTVTSAAANGTFTLAATAAAGGTLNLASMTIANAIDVLDVSLATSAVTVTGSAAEVDKFTSIAGVGAGGTTSVTTTNDAALNLSNNTYTNVDTLTFKGAGTTNVLTLASTSLSGAVTLVGEATSRLVLSNSGNYSNLTLTGGDFDSIDLGDEASVTLSSNAFVDVTGTFSVTSLLGGSGSGATAESVTVNAATATSAVNLGSIATATGLESIIMNDDTGANTMTVSTTDAVRNITTVNLTDNASIDTVVIANDTITSVTNEATITGFGTTDLFDLQGVNHAATPVTVSFNAGWQSFTNASGTNLTADTIGSIWEIETTVGELVSFTNLTAAKNLIANAVATATISQFDAYAVVIYGSAGAALYNIEIAGAGGVGGADLVASDITYIELVGVASGVAGNGLDVTNFI